MNIRLYLQVIRRHLVVLVIGLVATLGLAAFAVASAKPTWQSTTSLLASQNGASIGSAETIPGFDPTRLSYLVSVYSQLATSDSVRRAVVGSKGSYKGSGVLLDDGTRGSYTAAQVTAQDGTSLPILTITALAGTRSGAAEISERVSNALQSYLDQQQNQTNTPTKNRVSLTVVAGSGNAKIAKTHKKTIPAIVLVLGLIGTFALIFFLENLKTDAAAGRAAAEVGGGETVRLDETRNRIAGSVSTNGADAAPSPLREELPREQRQSG